jgi:hypothetical protein
VTLSLLNPFFTLLLPLAALPVIFHLFFRLKKLPRPFPTLMFFHRLDPRLNARRRLREWLILLLRALLILLVLLALARPVWFGVGREGGAAAVIVIDNSGSMSGAAQGGRSKLKQAVDAARDIVNNMRDRDAAGLVLLVPDPAVPLPAGLTSDKDALKIALDNVSETDAGGSVAAAMASAVAMLEHTSAARCEIHVLSDLQTEKWSQVPVDLRPPRPGARIVVHRIPSPFASQPNVSLAGVQMPSRPVVAGRRFPVEAQLVNPGPVEAQVRLNWLDDSGNRGSQELTVAPGARKSATVTMEASNPGLRWALFSLDGDDFPADNDAAAAFVCGEKHGVLFAGEPGDFGYLPLAMSPSGQGRLSGLVVSFSGGDSLPASLAGGTASFAVTTWDRLARGASAAHQLLAAGGTVLVLPSPNDSTPVVGMPDWFAISPHSLQSASNGLALTVLDKASAMFDDLRDDKGEVALHNVKVFRFYPLRIAADGTPVLGVEDGNVVLASQKVGAGLLLASGLAFDPAWSTLPLKPAFVALAQGMVLADSGASAKSIALVAGEPLHLASTNADALQVQSLCGSALDWKGKPAQFLTFPRAGVYAMRIGPRTTYAAVSSSEKEGRQKFITSDDLPALGALSYTVKDLPDGQSLLPELRKQERSLDLSLPLILLAFACLGLEGWLANPPPLKPRAPAAASSSAPVPT